MLVSPRRRWKTHSALRLSRSTQPRAECRPNYANAGIRRWAINHHRPVLCSRRCARPDRDRLSQERHVSALDRGAGLFGTNRQGTNTGNGVWFTGDFDTIDDVVACAIEQLHIDTRRIYASGFSAGGLQTTWMSYARSGYLAAVVPYSGGLTGFGTSVLDPFRARRIRVTCRRRWWSTAPRDQMSLSSISRRRAPRTRRTSRRRADFQSIATTEVDT